jgi:hypothetical protein
MATWDFASLFSTVYLSPYHWSDAQKSWEVQDGSNCCYNMIHESARMYSYYWIFGWPHIDSDFKIRHYSPAFWAMSTYSILYAKYGTASYPTSITISHRGQKNTFVFVCIFRRQIGCLLKAALFWQRQTKCEVQWNPEIRKKSEHFCY